MKLPEIEQEVLELREQGMSYEEIAKMLGISKSTAHGIVQKRSKNVQGTFKNVQDLNVQNGENNKNSAKINNLRRKIAKLTQENKNLNAHLTDAEHSNQDKREKIAAMTKEIQMNQNFIQRLEREISKLQEDLKFEREKNAFLAKSKQEKHEEEEEYDEEDLIHLTNLIIDFFVDNDGQSVKVNRAKKALKHLETLIDYAEEDSEEEELFTELAENLKKELKHSIVGSIYISVDNEHLELLKNMYDESIYNEYDFDEKEI